MTHPPTLSQHVRRLLLPAALLSACAAEAPPPAGPQPYVEPREPCANHNPLRTAFFGDLHAHTSYSFDVYAFDVRVDPEAAYRFARGEAVELPPLDAQGRGTQSLRLTRPLDFAAVTDHSEFLGEVEACTIPSSPAYGSQTCQDYRLGGNPAVTMFGIKIALPPMRFSDVCGNGRDDAGAAFCRGQAGAVWQRIQRAAAEAYDRSARCSFTSFVAYEYTAAPGLSTMHRNVLFKNDRVPFPTTYFEQPEAPGLWSELRSTCMDAGTGCDVLAVPHNPNESNGKMFLIEHPEGASVEAQREAARLRARLEPVLEVYQHKGDSECMNGLSGVLGAPDEACDFEKPRRALTSLEDCKDAVGHGGTARQGCLASRDFARGALLEGLKEHARIGVNPLQLGLIASTDTHNGTPGAVAEESFIGHRGEDDDTPDKQLGSGSLTPGGVEFSPGGLVGIWAEENSRPSLFDALRRREVFGTSGPRISVRFFGGWGYPAGLCTDPKLIENAYAGGVPMGGVLGPRPAGAGAPTFVLSALRDPGDGRRPGTQLQVAQIVKGWIEGGTLHTRVFDVAGNRDSGAAVDEATCTPQGKGEDTLCAVWQDPAFDPAQHAYYYARVLENPSCRWSTYTCAALPVAQRPPSCSDKTVPKTIQERAWASPIWFEPPSPGPSPAAP